MSNFEKATRLGLTFDSPKGKLTLTQLWTLSPLSLKELIKKQYELIKTTEDGLDFLEENLEVNPVEKLKFDILKHIYETLIQEQKDNLNQQSIKEHNRRINEIIMKKKEAELENLSIEELEKRLK